MNCWVLIGCNRDGGLLASDSLIKLLIVSVFLLSEAFSFKCVSPMLAGHETFGTGVFSVGICLFVSGDNA